MLWASDNIQIGNIGARHYIKFTLHTPKQKDSLVDYYVESYHSIEDMLIEANHFIITNAKPSCVPK
jgi:hypothetical protein